LNESSRIRGALPTAIVTQLLREHGALSQADLVRLTALGKATISRAVAELQRSGVIIESGRSIAPAGGASGRPAAALTLNPENGVCVGVQLGTDSIRAVIADVSHAILTSRVTPLEWDYSPEQGVSATAQLIEQLQEEAGIRPKRLIGVGVAVPSPVHPTTGRVIRSSVIGTWSGLKIAQSFEKRLRHPVFVDNETNCAALAEFTWGVAKGFSNILYVKNTNGLRGAVFINGRLVRGISGGAGEIGHVTYDPNGPMCRCGNRGCYELYTTTTAMLRLLRPTYGDAFTIEDLMKRAADGDVGCRRVIADVAAILGRGIAGACNIVNPDIVVLAGDLVAAGDLMAIPLREAISRHVLIQLDESDMGPTTKLLFASFGLDASALGAVGLALRQIGD
jgi:predicted NBD/HSP70 family sugar kinase